jgi:hypothetical protein
MVDPTQELIAQLIEFEFLIFIEFFYEKDYWKMTQYLPHLRFLN